MLGEGDVEYLRRLLGESERERSEYESDRDRPPRETDLLLLLANLLRGGDAEILGDLRDLGCLGGDLDLDCSRRR
jgi:hypothetical protein